jgi:hypothetical protein
VTGYLPEITKHTIIWFFISIGKPAPSSLCLHRKRYPAASIFNEGTALGDFGSATTKDKSPPAEPFLGYLAGFDKEMAVKMGRSRASADWLALSNFTADHLRKASIFVTRQFSS